MTARPQRNPIDHSPTQLNPIARSPRAPRPLDLKRIDHNQRARPLLRPEMIARPQRNPTVPNPTRPRVRKRTDPPSRLPGTSALPRQRNPLNRTAAKPINLNHNARKQIGRLKRNGLRQLGHHNPIAPTTPLLPAPTPRTIRRVPPTQRSRSASRKNRKNASRKNRKNRQDSNVPKVDGLAFVWRRRTRSPGSRVNRSCPPE
jgi:hypothetical protein